MLGNEGKKEDTVGLKMDFCDILRHFECNFSLSAHLAILSQESACSNLGFGMITLVVV